MSEARPRTAEPTVGAARARPHQGLRPGEVEVHALRGVDMELGAGELIVLVGPSGSGKSTLLNILGGLDSPTRGEVMFRDRELTRLAQAELTAYRRRHVGFVFQFYNLIPSLTARENVTLVTEIAEHPMSPEDALALVGLDERMDHFPAQLSGGEQQRVAIARAIAKQPELLLCDEPTGALDSQTGVLVLEAIEQVNRELGTATALITHNAGISAMADRVLLVRRRAHRERARERGALSRRGSSPGDLSLGRAAPAGPQAVPRPVAAARPGARDRRGDRVGRGGAGDVPGRPPGAARHRRRLLRAQPLRPRVQPRLTRAPERLAARIAEIPGVQVVQTRISKLALLDIEGFEEPVIGRLVSIPERGEPLLNRITLRAGRSVSPGNPDEAVVSEAFAEAHQLEPGGTPARADRRRAAPRSTSWASRCRPSSSTRSAPAR